jgi:hypothetical protein
VTGTRSGPRSPGSQLREATASGEVHFVGLADHYDVPSRPDRGSPGLGDGEHAALATAITLALFTA